MVHAAVRDAAVRGAGVSGAAVGGSAVRAAAVRGAAVGRRREEEKEEEDGCLSKTRTHTSESGGKNLTTINPLVQNIGQGVQR